MADTIAGLIFVAVVLWRTWLEHLEENSL